MGSSLYLLSYSLLLTMPIEEADERFQRHIPTAQHCHGHPTRPTRPCMECGDGRGATRLDHELGMMKQRSGRCSSGSGRYRSRQADAWRVQGRRLGKARTQVRSGVEGMPWKPGPPARDTSARAGATAFGPGRWCHENNLVGSAALGCRKGRYGVVTNRGSRIGPACDCLPELQSKAKCSIEWASQNSLSAMSCRIRKLKSWRG